MDLSFDLEITGFDTAEIDILIDGPTKAQRPDRIDSVPESGTAAVSSRDRAAYASLMADEKARVVFTDPPYNVPIAGHVGGLGSVKHREFAMASGEMTEAEFERFLATIFANMAGVSLDGAIHFVCMDWRHMGEVLAAGKNVYSALKNLCVWNKDNGGMGSFYRSKHELVFVYKVGTAPHLNTVELGRSGRYRTNVWDYAGVNTLRPGRSAELEMHPTVKPAALVIDALKRIPRCPRSGNSCLTS